MKTKICICCKKKLPLSEFYLSRRVKSGYRGECKQCSNFYNRQRYLEIKIRKQQEATKKCKFCDKTVKDNKFDFCSNKCARKYRFQDRTKHPKWRGKRIIIKCPICKKRIEKPSYLLKNHKNLFCSSKCAAIWKCKHQKTKDTDIEKRMQTVLMDKGLRFKKQVVFANICIADFYLPEYKLAIFCDGEYWHNYPNGKKRDRKQIKALNEINIKGIRLWGKQIFEKDPLKYIEKFI